MSKCQEHGEYHSDHGCGIAIGTGSAYAEHCLNCPKSPAYSNRGGLFKSSNGKKYTPWEAPAENCPHCWHRENPDNEVLELSKLGKKLRARVFNPPHTPQLDSDKEQGE